MRSTSAIEKIANSPAKEARAPLAHSKTHRWWVQWKRAGRPEPCQPTEAPHGLHCWRSLHRKPSGIPGRRVEQLCAGLGSGRPLGRLLHGRFGIAVWRPPSLPRRGNLPARKCRSLVSASVRPSRRIAIVEMQSSGCRPCRAGPCRVQSLQGTIPGSAAYRLKSHKRHLTRIGAQMYI